MVSVAGVGIKIKTDIEVSSLVDWAVIPLMGTGSKRVRF